MTSQIVKCGGCGRKNRVPAAASGVPRCGQCHSPLAWIAEADDASFAEVADAASIPVLVDLWAPWCGPCRMVSPALEHLAHLYAGRIKLVKVNVDEAIEVARRFEAQGIPLLIVMQKSRVLSRQTGATPEPALRAWLDQALSGG